LKYACLRDQHLRKISQFNYPADLKPVEDEWLAAIDFLRSFTLVNGEYLVNEWLDSGLRILAEGAQGSMLDVDFGSYPFVTSSNTTCAGACTGLGVAPGKIGKVIGIFKAYCTRVGSGPFPTELLEETGNLLRASGNEYGSTTGRPRRCGWLDLVALKYTVMLNGVTELIMTKADVLSGFDTLQVATAYKINGKTGTEIPFDTEAPVEPVLTRLPGWKENISTLLEKKSLPENLKGYIRFIEDYLQVPVTVVSVGPDRQATVNMT
jgi:adenylosuccinate synthase